MKKRLLMLSLMIVALVLILALSASAAAYDKGRTTVEYTDGQGVVHNVPIVTFDDDVATVAAKNGADATMLQYFVDENAYAVLQDKNGNLTAYPTWYFIQQSGTDKKYIAISEIVYGYINYKLGATVYENRLTNSSSNGSMVYVEFPHGMTALRANSVFGGNGMKEQILVEMHAPDTISSLEGGAFNMAPELRRAYFEDGNTITAIKGSTFTDSKKLEYIQFETLYLTSIDGLSNLNLQGPVDLSHMSLTSLPSSILANNPGITAITLPDTIETIGNEAFKFCTNAYLSSPYLPSSLKTIGQKFFESAKNFNNTLIFPEGFEKIGDEAFQDMVVMGGAAGNEFNLVFLGKMSSVVYLNGNGHQKHAERVTVYFAQNYLSDYGKNGFKIKPSGSSTTSVPGAIRAAFCAGIGQGENGSVTGIEYIYITNTDGTSYTKDLVNDADYGFDFENHTHFGALIRQMETCGTEGLNGTSCIICDKQFVEVTPPTGKHTYEDDFNCQTAEICSVCNQAVSEAVTHVLSQSLTFENGITAVGVRYVECQNEGCKHSASYEEGALVEFLGYSAKINGDSICVGYRISTEALCQYEEQIGSKINLGVVAIIPIDEAEKQPIYVENGEIKNISYSVAVAIESTYSGFDFRINGITSSDYETELVMCAYAYDGSAVSYLCVGENGYGQYESASTVTFNSKATEGGELIK